MCWRRVGGRLPYDVMRMRSALIVGMAGAVLALSGCGGDDDTPSTLPSATGGASESGSATDGETPSVTPTADPSAALQAELEAFFREYNDAINESFTSPEAAERRSTFYSTSCSVCISGQQLVDDIANKGQTFRGDPAEPPQVAVDSVEPGQVEVRTVQDIPPGEILAGTDVVERFEENVGLTIAYTLRRQESGRWIIVQGEKLG